MGRSRRGSARAHRELIADGSIEIVKIGSVTVISMAQLKALVERPGD
ncbi:hypothetical protein [Novosphingobium sp. M1R2S20]|uniref:Uncharacterized protein n=1 Tax=Novosphingobium rhizovicinum TaxID=3228928 RepID=A0ABV3RFG3_9SPHN